MSAWVTIFLSRKLGMDIHVARTISRMWFKEELYLSSFRVQHNKHKCNFCDEVKTTWFNGMDRWCYYHCSYLLEDEMVAHYLNPNKKRKRY